MTGTASSIRPDSERHLFRLCAVLAVLSALFAVTFGHSGGFLPAQAFSRHLPPAGWEFLTILGDERVLLALILPFCLRQPRLFWEILLAAAIAGLICRGIKLALPLPRPAAVLPPGQVTVIGQRLANHSFPSGHTASLFAFAGILFGRLGRRRAWAFLLLAAVAGFSRIAVGEHWPLDVLVGAVVGLLGAALALRLVIRWDWGIRPRPFLFLVGAAALAVATLPFDSQGYPESMPLRLGYCLWGLLGLLAQWSDFPPRSLQDSKHR